MKKLQYFASNYAYDFMRLSLALIFIWFGLLKVFGVSPVVTIVYNSMPQFIANIPGFFLILGIGEAIIGVGLLRRKFVPYAALLMILHLLIASLSVLVTQGFSPSFPILTLEGEFVVKNLILIAGAMFILAKPEASKST